MKTLKLAPDSAGLVLHDMLRAPAKDGLRPADTLSALDLYLNDQNVRHFSAWEVVQLNAHKGVTNTVPTPFLWANIVPTIHVAEWLRQALGDKPLYVTSGYRSDPYNRAVGGSKNSLHRRFNALDIWADHATPDTLAKTLREHTDWEKISCGIYQDFVHIDTRKLLDMEPWRADMRTPKAA